MAHIPKPHHKVGLVRLQLLEGDDDVFRLGEVEYDPERVHASFEGLLTREVSEPRAAVDEHAVAPEHVCVLERPLEVLDGP